MHWHGLKSWKENQMIPHDDELESPKPAPGDDGDRDEEDAEIYAPIFSSGMGGE